MEDAFKSAPRVRPGHGRRASKPAPDDGPVSAPLQASADSDPRSNDELARDRWFTEEDGSPRKARRLNIPNEAEVVSRGPLRLTGNITLIDEAGRESFHNELTLCRCGASDSQPLCGEQHLDVEFFDRGDIVHASSTMSSRAPQPLKVTCVQDGPFKFRGYLRIFNARGQECVSRSGALCRCGRSAKKPFCDCI